MNPPTQEHASQWQYVVEKCLPLAGVALGWGLSLLTAGFSRHRELRVAFAADVILAIRELTDRGDQLDRALPDWHLASVRRLRYHAAYFSALRPWGWQWRLRGWQRRTQKAWTDYELPEVSHQFEAFAAARIYPKDLHQRLERLLHVIRDA